MTTIFALSTPPGKSGVAVIRISGPDVLIAANKLGISKTLNPREAALVKLYNSNLQSLIPNPSLIDQCIAIYFKAPASYTGEDMLELHTHGSRAIIREIMEVLTAIPGLKPAEAGEFTKRAMINGKLDLIEAEAVQNLIDAETSAQKKLALRQLSGAISSEYEKIRAGVIAPLARLEAYIDFPEEDLPDSLVKEISQGIDDLKTRISSLLADGKVGEKIRDGVSIAILGAPNAGKSSIMNALAKRDVAIVSSIAGTTRDIIEITLDIAGVEFIISDTAGLRESTDQIESEGIRRALKRAEDADIKLLVFDGTKLPELDATTLKLTDENSIILINKADCFDEIASLPTVACKDALSISTVTGQGFNALTDKLAQLADKYLSEANSTLITSARHRGHLQNAYDFLCQFSFNQPIEIACEILRLAAFEIGRITGNVGVEDLLDEIFKNFCIGK